MKDTIIDYGTRIGKGFEFVGLYNIQFIVDKESNVYVLEVNPRSSRTVPFLSKITGVPMSQIATKCVLGESIEDQDLIQDIILKIKKESLSKHQYSHLRNYVV